jgi:hypothetical protein
MLYRKSVLLNRRRTSKRELRCFAIVSVCGWQFFVSAMHALFWREQSSRSGFERIIGAKNGAAKQDDRHHGRHNVNNFLFLL